MKKLITVGIAALLLSACQGGGDAPVSTQTVSPELPAVEPVAQPTPSPSPSASPSPTPSPSPSASPSPTPYAYGGGSGTSADRYKIDTATDIISSKQLYNLSFIAVSGQNVALFNNLSGTINGLTIAVSATNSNGTGGAIAGFANVFTGTLLNCRVTGTFSYSGAPLNPGQAPSVVMTSSYGIGGAKVLTGSTFDVMWNGTHYTHTF